MAETVTKAGVTHDPVATDLVWKTLRIVFGVVPIVAGLDKFSNLLTDWTHYLAPVFARMIPFSPHGFMLIVTKADIAAGVAKTYDIQGNDPSHTHQVTLTAADMQSLQKNLRAMETSTAGNAAGQAPHTHQITVSCA